MDTCQRCGERRPWAWVVLSDMLTDFVCVPCGEVALELRKTQINMTYPGVIRVVPYQGTHYAN